MKIIFFAPESEIIMASSGGFRRLAGRDGVHTVSTTTINTLVHSALRTKRTGKPR